MTLSEVRCRRRGEPVGRVATRRTPSAPDPATPWWPADGSARRYPALSDGGVGGQRVEVFAQQPAVQGGQGEPAVAAGRGRRRPWRSERVAAASASSARGSVARGSRRPRGDDVEDPFAEDAHAVGVYGRRRGRAARRGPPARRRRPGRRGGLDRAVITSAWSVRSVRRAGCGDHLVERVLEASASPKGGRLSASHPVRCAHQDAVLRRRSGRRRDAGRPPSGARELRGQPRRCLVSASTSAITSRSDAAPSGSSPTSSIARPARRPRRGPGSRQDRGPPVVVVASHPAPPCLSCATKSRRAHRPRRPLSTSL